MINVVMDVVMLVFNNGLINNSLTLRASRPNDLAAAGLGATCKASVDGSRVSRCDRRDNAHV